MDAHGSDALTLRRLAQEAGMATTALYNYFPSKDDLVDAAIDAAAGEVELPEPSARAWKQQLAGAARASCCLHACAEGSGSVISPAAASIAASTRSSLLGK